MKKYIQRGGFKQNTETIILLGLLIVVLVGFIYSTTKTASSSLKSPHIFNRDDGGKDNYNVGEFRETNSKTDREATAPALSFWGYMNNKEHEYIVNPTLPPQRTATPVYNVPINVPTRGYSAPSQQIGYLYKSSVDSESSINEAKPQILPLYGSQTYPGSNKWVYYVGSSDYNSIKLPLTVNGRKCSPNNHGCSELYEGDTITLPEYGATYTFKPYEYAAPQYIPYVM